MRYVGPNNVAICKLPEGDGKIIYLRVNYRDVATRSHYMIFYKERFSQNGFIMLYLCYFRIVNRK